MRLLEQGKTVFCCDLRMTCFSLVYCVKIGIIYFICQRKMHAVFINITEDFLVWGRINLWGALLFVEFFIKSIILYKQLQSKCNISCYLISTYYFRFAFLEFPSEKLADKNYTALQDKTLNGSKVAVDYVGSKSKSQKGTKSLIMKTEGI